MSTFDHSKSLVFVSGYFPFEFNIWPADHSYSSLLLYFNLQELMIVRAYYEGSWHSIWQPIRIHWWLPYWLLRYFMILLWRSFHDILFYDCIYCCWMLFDDWLLMAVWSYNVLNVCLIMKCVGRNRLDVRGFAWLPRIFRNDAFYGFCNLRLRIECFCFLIWLDVMIGCFIWLLKAIWW